MAMCKRLIEHTAVGMLSRMGVADEHLAHKWHLAAQEGDLLLQALLCRGQLQQLLLLLVFRAQKVGDEVGQLLGKSRQIDIDRIFTGRFQEHSEVRLEEELCLFSRGGQYLRRLRNVLIWLDQARKIGLLRCRLRIWKRCTPIAMRIKRPSSSSSNSRISAVVPTA